MLQGGDLNTADIVPFLPLLHAQQVLLLFKSHQFPLDSLEDLVEEHRCRISLPIDHLRAVFIHLESLLKHGDPLLESVIQLLQTLLLEVALLADPHQFIKQNRAFFFRLHFVSVVFAQLVLQEVSHRRELRLRLGLQTLDEVGHLHVIFLRLPEFVSQVISGLFGSLLILGEHVESRGQVS